MSYTKGPWIFNKATLDNRTHGYAIIGRVETGWEEVICALETVSGDYPDETNSRRIANAQLIAAAPEMLEVLETLLKKQAIDGPYVEIAVKAMQRARGEL